VAGAVDGAVVDGAVVDGAVVDGAVVGGAVVGGTVVAAVVGGAVVGGAVVAGAVVGAGSVVGGAVVGDEDAGGVVDDVTSVEPPQADIKSAAVTTDAAPQVRCGRAGRAITHGTVPRPRHSMRADGRALDQPVEAWWSIAG
jgi:hypothetical protein